MEYYFTHGCKVQVTSLNICTQAILSLYLESFSAGATKSFIIFQKAKKDNKSLMLFL